MTLLLTQWLSYPSEHAEFKEIMIEINLFCPNQLIYEPANFCVNFGCMFTILIMLQGVVRCVL